MKIINAFKDEYRFLSNFYPCVVEFEGIEYPSTENAYQAAKTLNVIDRQLIAGLKAGEAKRMGRKVEIRKDWDSVKLQIMESLLRQKFSQTYFTFLLLQTENAELVEGNYWHNNNNNNYGDCFCGKCKNVVGQNNLGKLLMKIREDLRNES
ncbi:MAG TPA: NADAR family protein [Leptospiraceae bacterium]|nr:NADAR family protein [Leptospiraceae bacterium]